MPYRLIEKSFPIIEISKLAIPERSSYKPIYQISKWFARRAGSTFRAIILGALLSPSDDLMSEFYSEKSFSNISIMDPFMGGGTTIIEGLRLGLNCIGIDINPVAWFITKTEAEMIDIDILNEWIMDCTNKLETEIKKWYVTRCPFCNREAEIIYAHWVKLVPCKDCNMPISLFKSFIITKEKNSASILCPNCEKIFTQSTPISENINCPECHFEFNPNIGNRTGRNNCRCSNCHSLTNILNHLKNNQNELESKLFAIEGFCPQCETDTNTISSLKEKHFKFVKSISNEDIDLYYQAKKQWRYFSTKLKWPKELIPLGVATRTLHNHNYKKWVDLFNDRQLLTLSIIIDYIQKIPNLLYKEMFLAAFINLLNHNNSFTRYSHSGKKVEGIFARHDFHPLSTFAENNVWGTKYGRGTWIKCLERLLKGKQYNLYPYNWVQSDKDLIKGGNKKKLKKYLGKINGKLITDINENLFSSSKNLLLLCQDASNITDYSISVDVVISDPPYSDNVNYSELSDFFYVWIRLILKDYYPFFDDKETPKKAEAIKSKDRPLDYYEKLKEIFIETKSILKTDGLLIFTFHHSDEVTWIKLAEVINQSGFRVVRTHPIPSESRNVLNIQKKRAIAFDSIIVCRSDSIEIQPDIILLKDFKRIVTENYNTILRLFNKSNIYVQQLDYLAILFGILLEMDYKYEVISELGKKLRREEIWKECHELITSNYV